MDQFHGRLREALETAVKAITIGHVEHVRDVLVLRDELCIRVDVTMNGEAA